MSTVNNATGVYQTLGYSFSDPNDDVISLSANTQAHLNSMPAIIETWQAQEIANNTIGGYYQNPVAGNTYSIITIAQQMVVIANTGASQNIANCELIVTAANGLYNNASSFLGHTNRISNVVPVNSQYIELPYYEPAMAFGKIALYIVNQTDGITNTSPILGSFTSLFIGPEIDSANTILTNDLVILNNGVTANNLTETQITQILSDISNTNITLTTRQNSDVAYYNNLRNFVNNYNAVKRFTNLGETETYLINNFVGTEKIISAISGGPRDDTANAIIANTASYGNLPNPPDPAFQQANVATGIATSSYNQANTATNLAQTVYDYANTISGGAAIDNVARVIASSASANTIILQGINATQNTRINSIETINTTQNTRINSIETINTNQNTSISIIQLVDATQNTRLDSVETINTNQNTTISIIQGVDTWQNTQITAVNNYAAGAYGAANSALSSISGGGISAIDSFARTTANGANGLAQGAFNVANNKVSSITGTTNQITVTGTTTPTLSLPQSINTTASVQFGSFGVGTAASGVTGEIRATNEVTAYYTSDERLKENIQEIDAALYKLRKVRGYMFDWKDEVIESRGGEDKYFVRKHDTGVIAQEIEQVLPEVVAVRKDGYKAVRYEKLAGLIIQAINELADEVEEIKQRLK